MSKCRVGIIAEGPTDVSVIQGIVTTIFPDKVFVFNSISPTPEEISMQRKDEGFGWGGVYRVCRRLSDKLRMAEKNTRLIEKKAKGLRKRTKGYNSAAINLSNKLWNIVTNRYKQAELFDEKLNVVIK